MSGTFLFSRPTGLRPRFKGSESHGQREASGRPDPSAPLYLRFSNRRGNPAASLLLCGRPGRPSGRSTVAALPIGVPEVPSRLQV